MIVLLCAFVVAVFAVSSGKVSSCDADIDLYGCKPGGWPIDPLTNNSIRANCTDKTRIMTWVTAPILADKTFKIYAGPNEDATLTEYTPGERMLVSLRVMVYGMQYRGLLMYAIDSKKTKVGDWDPIDRVPMVHGFCAKSVVHSGAELKPYLMTFGFTAPPAGTGPISFSSLIKTGVANTGEFWYANRLTLTEKVGATRAPQQWYRATTAGQSCDEVCSACGGTCTAADLMKIDSPAAIDSMVSPYAFCAKPYLLRCGAEGATSGSTDGVCFFRNDTACTELGLPKTATTCAFKPSATVDQTAFRLCPCAGATKCSGPVATNPAGFTTAGTTKTTVTIPPATTKAPTAAPTTKAPVVTTAPPPGVTTPKPTQPPVTTTPATTQATCAPGSLGCKCDANNSCASGNLCSNSVCIVRSPCLYGELGCACTPGTNDCNSAKYACSPTSLKCVEKERTICDEKNGQLGCWCRENGLCDAGLRCDDTRNCVKDADYTCGAGEAGCKCKEDGSCNNAELRCATFSTESVCVTKDPSTQTETTGDGTLGSGSGAASLILGAAVAVLAVLAQI